MVKLFSALMAAAFVVGVFCQAANGYERPQRKPAIVLAAFGTTEVAALESILNIKTRIEKAFPGYDVHVAFTSNIIRNIWRKRADDAEFKKENPDIPQEIYDAGSVLTTLANIQENGARLVLVQSLHVTDGEEYEDLANLVKTLRNYQTKKRVLHPFPWIGVGDPALGVGDGVQKYLDRAADALEPLAKEAQLKNMALVLMGHGNEHLNQSVFARFQETLRKRFGDYVYIGTVEAEPLGEDVVKMLKDDSKAPRAVLLAPLMVVAGDHARNDMAGDEDDSWASLFRADGFSVAAHLVGLGSNNSWADIYVEHLRDLEKTVQAMKEKEEAEEEKDHE